MNSNESGKYGESLAAQFYEANGYTIIEKNFHSGHYEIDLIAEKDNMIVFAEVKTRTNSPTALKYGAPRCAVDKGKKKRLIYAARSYLSRFKKEKQPRMDVVEIYLDTNGTFQKIDYIRNAFGKESR